MRHVNRMLLIGLVLASACPASAQVAGPDTAPAAKPSLDWLAGDWCGGEDGERIEESWASFAGGESIGMSRTLQGGRMVSWESMLILEIDGVVTFIARPKDGESASFKRTDGGEGWIRFENKEHDYPQRIEYRKDGNGLKAEIGGPGAEGKEEVISYQYLRCPVPAT